MSSSNEATFKILVLGDCNVGKTCIVHRFCEESFSDKYISTIGIDYKQKSIQIDNLPIKLQIWDTAGQERFRTLTTAYYRGAMGIIVMYDITNWESFDNVKYWFKNIEENGSEDVVKMLVGNKCDEEKDRMVEKEAGRRMAAEMKIPFYEVSCKRNENIHHLFFELAMLIKTQWDQREFRQDLLDRDLENTINSKMMTQKNENENSWSISGCEC